MTNHLPLIDTLLGEYQRIYNSCHPKPFILRRTDDPKIDGATRYRNDKKRDAALVLIGSQFIKDLDEIFNSSEYLNLFLRNGISEGQIGDIIRDSLLVAVSFVVQHEISHVKRGHLRYFADHGYVVENKIRRRLEIDADAMSCKGFLVFQVKGDWFNTKMSAFLACVIVPILHSRWYNQNEEASYPTSAVRLNAFELGMSSWLDEVDYFEGNNQKIREMFLYSQRLSKDFCEAAGMKTDFFDDLDSVNNWWKNEFLIMGDFIEEIFMKSDFIEDDRADEVNKAYSKIINPI